MCWGRSRRCCFRPRRRRPRADRASPAPNSPAARSEGTAPYGTDDGDTLDVHVDGTPKRSFSHVRITPAGTVLGPGQTVTVHVGQGIDPVTDRYFNLGDPIATD